MKPLPLLLFLLAWIVTACAPAPTPPKAVIRIATQSPLSGGLAAFGIDIRNGAELALEQRKAPLDELGFQVELVAYDDQANPEVGVANAKAIVTDPAVLCVVGHYNSGVQIPSSEIYHASQLANVSPANTNPLVTDRGYPEVSRIVGRDDVQGAVAARFALAMGMTSAYVVHDKTAYGQGIAEFFRREAEANGLSILGFEGSEEKTDFGYLLEPLLAAEPEVIFFGGVYDQAAAFFQQARQRGFRGMLLSDDGIDSPETVRIGGPSLLEGGGLFYTTVAGPAKLYPGAAQFIQDFQAKYGSEPKPFAAQGYDAAAICLRAIEEAARQAGGVLPSRAAVTRAVRTIRDFPGLTGTITFNSRGDLVVAKYFVIRVTSADPALWNDNQVVQTLEIAPPE